MKKALGIAIVLLLAVGVFFVWDYVQREAALREQLRKMQEIVGRLNAERRVAQLMIRDQQVDAEGRIQTTVEFREWDRQKNLLPPVEAVLTGQEIYVEALVIKFQNKFVEEGDLLRGKTLILFRRMYGASTAPEQGVLIDPNASDGVPAVHRVDAAPPESEVDLWNRFWYYANNPKEAEALGVRVMQIEAVGIRPVPNMIYQITVENNGGVNLKTLTPDSK